MGWRFDSRFQPTVDVIDFLLFMVSVLFHDKKVVGPTAPASCCVASDRAPYVKSLQDEFANCTDESIRFRIHEGVNWKCGSGGVGVSSCIVACCCGAWRAPRTLFQTISLVKTICGVGISKIFSLSSKKKQTIICRCSNIHQNVTRHQDSPRKREPTICERHPCRTCPRSSLAAAIRQWPSQTPQFGKKTSVQLRFHEPLKQNQVPSLASLTFPASNRLWISQVELSEKWDSDFPNLREDVPAVKDVCQCFAIQPVHLVERPP